MASLASAVIQSTSSEASLANVTLLPRASTTWRPGRCDASTTSSPILVDETIASPIGSEGGGVNSSSTLQDVETHGPDARVEIPPIMPVNGQWCLWSVNGRTDVKPPAHSSPL